jgi:hypothetical protein
MDREEAFRFLRAHQPLPADDSVDEETNGRFYEVCKFFAANPDPECIPLVLNAFGERDGFGVYQCCDIVFRVYPQSLLTPHLVAALGSPHRSVRYWAAHWAMDFIAPELVEPLVQVLASQKDEDAHYYCLAALQFIWEEHRSAEALAVLPERMELLWEVLSRADAC